MQGRERAAYRLAEAPADTDAVPGRRLIWVGTGHLLTTLAVNRLVALARLLGPARVNTLLLKRILTEPRRQTASGRRTIKAVSGTTSAGARNHPAALVRRATSLRFASNSQPLLVAAGCKPRAGQRDVPSRKLRDSAGGGSEGNATQTGMRPKRRSPITRAVCHRHSSGAPLGICHPCRRPGPFSQLRARSSAVCADHARCVTPSHIDRQEARKGALPGRAHEPRRPT